MEAETLGPHHEFLGLLICVLNFVEGSRRIVKVCVVVTVRVNGVGQFLVGLLAAFLKQDGSFVCHDV